MNEPSQAELDELIARATVDCYNEDEELNGFATMIGQYRLTCLPLPGMRDSANRTQVTLAPSVPQSERLGSAVTP